MVACRIVAGSADRRTDGGDGAWSEAADESEIGLDWYEQLLEFNRLQNISGSRALPTDSPLGGR